MTTNMTIFIGVAFLVSSACACYIQSCPYGPVAYEKRGGGRLPPLQKCGHCGPKNAGTCFGPGVCCMPGQGCLVTAQIPECAVQEEKRLPCAPAKQPCTSDGVTPGFCAPLSDLCCSTIGCAKSPDCSDGR